jgi:hypothetical protein
MLRCPAPQASPDLEPTCCRAVPIAGAVSGAVCGRVSVTAEILRDPADHARQDLRHVIDCDVSERWHLVVVCGW